MAVKTRKTYTSKGQRRNVARKLVNAMRRDRRANPSLGMLLARLTYRNDLGRRKDKDSQARFTNLLAKEAVYNRALELFDKYKSAGVTWAACVQAIKTDWVPSFETKWKARLTHS
jgi:hypothetical protein